MMGRVFRIKLRMRRFTRRHPWLTFAVRSFVIAAREDLEIAREVREVLAVRRSPGS